MGKCSCPIVRFPMSVIFSIFVPTDDIPVRGFIGHLEEGGLLPHSHKIYLWTHLHFNIEYNGDQVRIHRRLRLFWGVRGALHDVTFADSMSIK